MTYTTKYDHQKLAEAIQLFTNLEDIKQQPEILNQYQWQIDRWREGLYYLVVVGEVKKGKSSFVNALLDGEGLSPVADKIASAVPVKIIYGERLRYWVHFLPDEKDNYPKPLEISAEELPKYATEQGLDTGNDNADAGNLGNRLSVNFISVEHPHRFLKEGLVLVDLPGLGGVYKHHARLVWEYLDPERTDHIAFVFDSTGNPFSAAEESSIQTIKERKIDRFMFLQTKTDAEDQEQVYAWKEGNLKRLSVLLNIAPANIRYFLISNFLKQKWLSTGQEKNLNRSGFVELESYLTNTLIPAKKDLLAKPLILGLGVELTAIKQQIETQIKIYSEDSSKNRNAIFQAYQNKKLAFESWDKTVFVPLKNELNKELRAARSDAITRIQNELFPSKVTTALYSKIDASTKTEEDVLNSQEIAKQMCIDSSLERYKNIENDYRIAVELAFTKAINKLSETVPSPFIDHYEPDTTNIETINFNINNRMMETVQRGWGSVAIGTFAGSILGPVGAIAGAIIGVWKAVSENRQRNKDAAMSRIKGILDDVARQAQMSASNVMTKTCDATEFEYDKQLNDTANICYKRLNDNAVSAEKSLNDTDANIAQQKKDLDEKLVKVNEIHRLLQIATGLN